MMYRILFIDESQEDIDSFKDYIEEKDSGKDFEVLSMFPLEDLDDMAEEIMNKHVDAIITDFRLNEYKEDIKYNVPYDGACLVERIISEREGFPCFVLTSFDEEAIGKSEDVNVVYVKGILHVTETETKANANFADRIKSQILHYKKRLETAEIRLLELIKKSSKERLDANEEEEMLNLDSLIEKSLDKKYAIPERVKRPMESGPLVDLIKAVDDFIKKADK
jgi:hypothetical protein